MFCYFKGRSELVQFLCDKQKVERERSLALLFVRHKAFWDFEFWLEPLSHTSFVSHSPLKTCLWLVLVVAHHQVPPTKAYSSANQRPPSPSPILIGCPGCKLKLKSFGASNRRTMVDPRLNSPTAAPFCKATPSAGTETTPSSLPLLDFWSPTAT